MRVILYTGKGGTGKSVVSCMTALRSAKLGYKTLLMSSDPAHTLRDALGTPITSEETLVSKNLWAIQIDPIKEAVANYSEIMDFLALFFSSRGLDETLAYEIASLPGTTGISSLFKVEGYHREGKYDVVVMDTVPSGEALKLLFIPEIFGRMTKRLLKVLAPLTILGKVVEPIAGVPSLPSKVIQREIKLLEKIEVLKSILTDFNLTSVRLVANPDYFCFLNTRRTYMLISLYGINVDLVIINKVIPESGRGSYLDEWIGTQKKYIEELRLNFDPLPLKCLKLYERELMGTNALHSAAHDLFGDDDPTDIYFRGKPMTINKHTDGIEIVLNSTYASKEDIEVERVSDELILHLLTDMGKVEVVIPLPAITYRMELKKARLIKGKLHIYFGTQNA